VADDGRLLLHCLAGCPPEAVLAALDLTLADLFPPRAPMPPPPLRRTRRYEVRDAAGVLQAVHERQDGPGGKRFTWRRPDGRTGLNGTAVGALPLYGAERMAGWPAERPIVLVEGEAVAEALWTAGRPALAIVTGASATPDAEPLAILRGRRAILSPDNDPPGRALMARVGHRLAGVAAEVTWLEPPSDAPPGWDLADLLAGVADPDAAIRRLAANLGPLPAGDPEAEPARSAIRYWTAAELAAATPAEVAWIWHGYLAGQAITELDGRVKAAGKTTLALHLVRAVLAGEPFLGQPTRRTGVLFVSEQQPHPFRDALRRVGLLDAGPGLRLVFRRDAAALPWPDLVAALAADALRDGIGLMVLDTLGKLAGLRDENDAGEAARAMVPLQDAAADGLAILVLRHERKSAGEVGESARGSSAFGGDADVILRLRRTDPAQPTRRLVESLSRFAETPERVLADLGPDGYRLLGGEEEVALADSVQAVSEVLAADPEAEGLTVDQIVAITDLRRTSVQRAVTHLDGLGRLAVTGAGRRGDPHRYRLQDPESVSAHSAHTFRVGSFVGGNDQAESSTPEETPAEVPVTAWCSDFRAHQSSHRQEPDGGWVCDAEPEAVSAHSAQPPTPRGLGRMGGNDAGADSDPLQT
jgi:hypothetical protein